MTKPTAVLISDVHYNLQNLEVADAALNLAIKKAEELNVPLIIAGDLHDTKASLRAECVNRLIHTLCSRSLRCILIPGNHDMINEKGEEHALQFLKGVCEVVDRPQFDKETNLWFIPYQTHSARLLIFLASIPHGSTVIMHQGLMGAEMGHYLKDTTSLPPESFEGLRIVSGHYHKAQDIKCGETGLFSYIGTPYTTSFAEAHDGPKGFQVLYDDGSLQQVRTNLRKHIIREIPVHMLKTPTPFFDYCPGDLLWLKITGTRSELSNLTKVHMDQILGHSNYKLDKIYTDAEPLKIETENFTDAQILDKIIDGLSDADSYKKNLKTLWREVLK